MIIIVYTVFSPEELIPDDLLAVPHAELRVTDHKHAVDHHHQRDHPVDGGHKHAVEMENEAEVGVTPHPHWEGEAHHADDGEVGGAVQEDHYVNQGELLYLYGNMRMKYLK